MARSGRSKREDFGMKRTKCRRGRGWKYGIGLKKEKTLAYSEKSRCWQGEAKANKRLGMIVLSVTQVATTTQSRKHRVKGSLWLQAHDNVNIRTHE